MSLVKKGSPTSNCKKIPFDKCDHRYGQILAFGLLKNDGYHSFDYWCKNENGVGCHGLIKKEFVKPIDVKKLKKDEIIDFQNFERYLKI